MTARDDWVSKRDLTRFVRCPYSFWLLDSGEIAFEDTIDEVQAGLLQAGAELHQTIELSAPTIEIRRGRLGRLLKQDVKLLEVAALANRKLKIRGRPDGLDAANGALIPLAIKTHKEVQRLDLLQLAFCWVLLDPYRTRRNLGPRGLLTMRHQGGWRLVEVPITQQRLDEVVRLLQEVRDARRYGVRPRICRCNVCRQLRREEVLAAALENKDLTLIRGIGLPYARALEDFGIKTCDDLVASEPQVVVRVLRDRGYFISADQVGDWQQHAETYSIGAAVQSGDEPCVGDSFIALDLEYEPTMSRIWLIGVCVVRGEDRSHSLLLCESENQERDGLHRLAKIVAKNPSLPVVTWSGNSADIPHLKNAAKRLRLQVLGPLFERHRDLRVYAERNVRLPIPGLDLTSVADHFGIRGSSSIQGGLQAQGVFLSYLAARTDAEKRELREELLDYNRDDLDELVALAGHLRALADSNADQSA
jgi:predicted RecB family nuclease